MLRLLLKSSGRWRRLKRRLLFWGLFQGVTLTDLQEAEKTMKTDNKGREKKEEEKEAKLKKAEEGVRAVCSTSRPALKSCDLT